MYPYLSGMLIKVSIYMYNVQTLKFEIKTFEASLPIHNFAMSSKPKRSSSIVLRDETMEEISKLISGLKHIESISSNR